MNPLSSSFTMTKVQELQNAIQSLSLEDFTTLRNWMNELDWEQWDKEIEQDSQSGKLDFLIEDDPIEEFVGAFNSEILDWTENHDIYLGKALNHQNNHA
jgi:hypothetical protein